MLSVKMDGVAVDKLIERLIEVRSSKPGKPVQLSESEIKQLCATARDIFFNQPNLLELEAPIKICGILFVLYFYFTLLSFWLFLFGLLEEIDGFKWVF